MRDSPELVLTNNAVRIPGALVATARRWRGVLVGGTSLLALAGCGLQYIPTDLRINSLCKKDGGVTVFERVKAPAEYLRPNGTVDGDDLVRLRHREYFVTSDSTYVQIKDPPLRRIEYTLRRKSDGKVLAKSVYYLRPWDGLTNLLWSQSHSCVESGGLGALVDAAFER